MLGSDRHYLIFRAPYLESGLGIKLCVVRNHVLRRNDFDCVDANHFASAVFAQAMQMDDRNTVADFEHFRSHAGSRKESARPTPGSHVSGLKSLDKFRLKRSR